MFINGIAEGSGLKLTVRINGENKEFDTKVIKSYQEPYQKDIYYIGCEPVVLNDKKVSFGRHVVRIFAQNAEDNREYKFKTCFNGFNKDRSQLLLFSGEDSSPINHRESYRVACNYKSVVQIGNNKKAVDGYVHDISFTGISMLFVTGAFNNLNVGEDVSASIFDNNERVFKVRGTVARFMEEFTDGKTLIGVRFTDPSTAIIGLVAALQRKETMFRKRMMEKNVDVDSRNKK